MVGLIAIRHRQGRALSAERGRRTFFFPSAPLPSSAARSSIHNLSFTHRAYTSPQCFPCPPLDKTNPSLTHVGRGRGGAHGGGASGELASEFAAARVGAHAAAAGGAGRECEGSV